MNKYAQIQKKDNIMRYYHSGNFSDLKEILKKEKDYD